MNSPFEDQDLPFAPGDNLAKPNVDDYVILRDDMDSTVDLANRQRVIAVYDSLSEDWGDDGESSWAQRDVNTENGFNGRWYAIVSEEEGTDCSVASYEVWAIDRQ